MTNSRIEAVRQSGVVAIKRGSVFEFRSVHLVVVLGLVATVFVLLLDLVCPEYEQEYRFAEYEYDLRKISRSPQSGTFFNLFRLIT